ncbi:hypothetical protein [Paenibacillus pseudetheri]|uniref:DNA-binding protein n=1 Tax=Paenibacillus pseudetheri TaxID=2897682 RepID=A0ABM9BBB6_9BACL|nr:hypothetical protein [Paenibacillus pseudetheri]CAH1056002.1 hypothetical protein PAECIP111894_02155 [Paenibacillus pseudetheri]
MKSNQIYIVLASFILGVSFIIGCSLTNGDKELEVDQDQTPSIVTADKLLMDIKETALYLNLTEDQVMNIVTTEHSKFGTFPGTPFPYINVDNKYLFNKDLLSNWVAEASLNRRVYLKGQTK